MSARRGAFRDWGSPNPPILGHRSERQTLDGWVSRHAWKRRIVIPITDVPRPWSGMRDLGVLGWLRGDLAQQSRDLGATRSALGTGPAAYAHGRDAERPGLDRLADVLLGDRATLTDQAPAR